MARHSLAIAVLTLLCLSGCGEGPVTPTTLSSGAGSTPGVNLTGNWSGTSFDSSGPLQMHWRLTQSNRTVSGTVTATTPVGLPAYTSGTLTGSVTGSTLAFTITIPRGAIADAPDCTVTLTGLAQDVTATSIAGTYTGNDSCLGALVDGRLTLFRG